MKSQSNDYIQLQNIYKAKARKDLAEVTAIVRSVEKRIGRSSAIDEKEIEAFCKGAAFVKLIRGSRMRSGDIIAMNFRDCAKYIIRELEDDQSLIPIYISMRIAEHFMDHCTQQRVENIETSQDPKGAEDLDSKDVPSTHNGKFFPTLEEYGYEYDVTALKERLSPALKEVERANGSELHNISALTGGMVAQEAIKVITKQYVPIDGTCVFDGLRSMSMVLRL